MKILLLMLALTSCTNKSGQRVINYKPSETTCINGIQYYRASSGNRASLAVAINKKTLTFMPCDMERR